MGFTVIRGDIAEQSADALVNAAGTSLKIGTVKAFTRIELIFQEFSNFNNASIWQAQQSNPL